jgi:chorismate mutase
MSQDDVERLRAEIDGLDDQLLSLLARRIEVVGELGGAMRRAGRPAVDPTRERAIVDRLASSPEGRTLGREPLEAIYERIFSVTRRIAAQG